MNINGADKMTHAASVDCSGGLGFVSSCTSDLRVLTTKPRDTLKHFTISTDNN